MATRILTESDVRDLLTMESAILAMTEVLKTRDAGDALNPLRSLVRFPAGDGILGLMPAYLGRPACAGIKVVTVMPGNHGSELDAHQGVVLLFEVTNGRLLAVADASSVTAIRTAAVSGAATRALARPDARRLALLGSGIQAASHLESMRAVRPITEVRVWSRNQEHARRFAGRAGAGIPVRAAASAREAVDGADIVCTVTSAREPVLRGEWIAAGTHINAVGACVPAFRELDSEAVARSRVFVDSRESAFNESGDIRIPMAGGRFGEDHVRAELGEVLSGKRPGRTAPAEITLFKSLGIAVEDLAAVHVLHRLAGERNRGLTLDVGGTRRG
jgi:ornithine cyclodeaminase